MEEKVKEYNDNEIIKSHIFNKDTKLTKEGLKQMPKHISNMNIERKLKKGKKLLNKIRKYD